MSAGPATPPPRPRLRRGSLLALLAAVPTVLFAATLPRDTLWGVESTCMLNKRTTGASFPCLDVDLSHGVERGYALLKAPFRETHMVLMPTARVIGIETAATRAPDAPNYFADAWAARRLLDAADGKRSPGWNDVGLAVNSRVTRSQDQLHIHIDCVRPRVKTALALLWADTPTDRWQENGYAFQGQQYWTRRLDGESLAGTNPFRLAAEIPALRERPGLTVLSVIGMTDPTGRNGFMLLAGQSKPALAARQSTSEDLLDHSCRVLQ